jgi:hypothetical protein
MPLGCFIVSLFTMWHVAFVTIMYFFFTKVLSVILRNIHDGKGKGKVVPVLN